MPLRLTKALVTFMDLMNRVFQLYLDQFVIMFVNYILIYLRSREEREMHLRIALQTLRSTFYALSSTRVSFGCLR